MVLASSPFSDAGSHRPRVRAHGDGAIGARPPPSLPRHRAPRWLRRRTTERRPPAALRTARAQAFLSRRGPRKHAKPAPSAGDPCRARPWICSAFAYEHQDSPDQRVEPTMEQLRRRTCSKRRAQRGRQGATPALHQGLVHAMCDIAPATRNCLPAPGEGRATMITANFLERTEQCFSLSLTSNSPQGTHVPSNGVRHASKAANSGGEARTHSGPASLGRGRRHLSRCGSAARCCALCGTRVGRKCGGVEVPRLSAAPHATVHCSRSRASKYHGFIVIVSASRWSSFSVRYC